MAYNPLNRLLYYKEVINIVQANFIPGVTTYAGIFREFVKPKYPMSYRTFMKIMATPVDKELKQLEEKC